MKKIVQLTIFSVLMISAVPATAHAAETLLPIKARIIRCVTNEERLQMCTQENLCCNLVRKEAQVNNDEDTSYALLQKDHKTK